MKLREAGYKFRHGRIGRDFVLTEKPRDKG